MGMTAATYLQQLQALLPPGRAWPRDDNSTLGKTLHALADELARVDGRVTDLLDEIIPDQTSELLAQWERICGVAGAQAVLAQLAAQGGASPAYFIALADLLGLTVTIDDDLTGLLANFTCVSPCNALLQGYNKRYWWEVSIPAAGPEPELEALFIKLKPAHTRVDFSYSA